MSTIDTRRENLRSLIKQWGGPSALASKMGHVNPSFLVQMAGPNPTRNVSERTARAVETALDLGPGWLDQSHSATVPQQVDGASISGAIQRVQQAADETSVKLNTAKFGDVVAMVYETATNGHTIDDQLLRKIVCLAK